MSAISLSTPCSIELVMLDGTTRTYALVVPKHAGEPYYLGPCPGCGGFKVEIPVSDVKRVGDLWRCDAPTVQVYHGGCFKGSIRVNGWKRRK